LNESNETNGDVSTSRTLLQTPTLSASSTSSFDIDTTKALSSAL